MESGSTDFWRRCVLKNHAHVVTHSLDSLHPTMPLLCTASGQRHFQLPTALDDESGSSEDEDCESPEKKRKTDSARSEPQACDRESTVKLWWIGCDLEDIKQLKPTQQSEETEEVQKTGTQEDSTS